MIGALQRGKPDRRILQRCDQSELGGQALAYAVDRSAVLAAIGGGGIPSTADYPPATWAYLTSATVARPPAIECDLTMSNALR